MINEWKFSCESKSKIPLPPEYTFPQAFNYLNAEKNSFYILEAPNGDYIQCGGGRKRCTVEIRRCSPDGHTHSVIGSEKSAENTVKVKMSQRDVEVRENEVLDRWDAIELFTAFYEEKEFPKGYKLREVNI